MTTIAKTTLGNGIKIISKTMPYLRSVSMGVWVNAGARDESESESGLSHFIEHMIFKGTRKRTALQIAKEFDAIGGQSNAFTTMENTCYHAKVMDLQLGTMVDILSDIFLNSIFDKHEIEKERPIIFQEIGMVEDSPEELVHILTGQNYWGGHPLGRSILGSPENITRFDAETIRDFFRRFYQPERVLVTAAGNIDHNQLVDMLAPGFEGIKPPEKGFPPRLAPSGRNSLLIQQKALEQVHLCFSTPAPATSDPRRFALSLLNTILGGNMSSRLFQKIREEAGLAYSVYSFASTHEDAGMFGVYTAVNPHQAKTAADLISDELAQLRSVKISPAELSDSKEFNKGNLYLASESPDNQMVRLAHNEFYLGRHIPMTEVAANIEAVTSDEIHNLARQIFDPGKISLTLLGPVKNKAGFENLIDG